MEKKLKLRPDTAIRINYNRIFKPLLRKYVKEGMDVLNIGAGKTTTYNKFFEGTNYETLDPRKSAKATYIMDVAREIPNKKYDVLILSNVLEHISEPMLFFRNASKLLKPNGVMIIGVPFLYSHHPPGDYYRYTAEGLKYLVEEYFDNDCDCRIIPHGNPFLTFLRGIATIKYLGIPFNLTSRLWEFIFRYTDVKSPSGYFLVVETTQ